MAPPPLVPEPAGQQVNGSGGGLLARDREDPDRHNQPFGIHDCLASVPVAFDRRDLGGVEDLEKILPGLTDPLARKLAGSASGGHGALLFAKDGAMVPQRTSLAKFRDPSSN
jgi:hypothetical protein